MRRLSAALAALLLAGLASHAGAQSAPPVTLTPDRPAAPAPATNGQDARLERGRYLAIAADCMACHTSASGKPYAGGYAIDSPLGTIYATNITPSKKGGIGVMNVMLMTVRERTREIGIRMATGARRRDILRQFLTEAVLVSVVGGVAGIVVGVTFAAALLVWDVPVIFSLSAIGGAFACAVVTGLVFGFMPARKASGLDPVVALAG